MPNDEILWHISASLKVEISISALEQTISEIRTFQMFDLENLVQAYRVQHSAAVPFQRPVTSRSRLPSRCHRRRGCRRGGSIRNSSFQGESHRRRHCDVAPSSRSPSMRSCRRRIGSARLGSERVGRIGPDGTNCVT